MGLLEHAIGDQSGRTVDEWKVRPEYLDDYLRDCVVGCIVGASHQGVSLMSDNARGGES